MDARSLVRALQNGGYVIYFRHAATDQSQPDADPVDFANCATQRNLSDKGREQAKAIGKAVAALGIKVSNVLSSPYCRCVETAKLAFGNARVAKELEFAMPKKPPEAEKLAAALRGYLAIRPQAGTNSVIIAHSSNLKEAVGIWPEPEGAAYVFRPEGNRSIFVGRLAPYEWPELAQLK